MQTIYKFVYGEIYKITKHISERVRSLCIFVCCLIFFTGFFTDRAGRMNSISNDMIFGTTMVIITSVFSIDKDPGKIRWNRWIYLSMVAFGTGMLLVGQLHYVGIGYMLYALDLMLVLPAFYYIQVSTDSSERISRILSLTIVIAGIISYVYTWIQAAQGQLPELLAGRFFGYFSNPNGLGMVGVVVLIAGLYLTIKSHNKWVHVLSAAAAGIGVDYALLSASRSAVMCGIVCVTSFLIFLVKRRKAGGSTSLNIKKIIVCILIAAAVMTAGTKIEDLNLKEKPQDEASVGINDNDNNPSEKESDEVPLTDRPGVSDGMHNFTSGRVDIWMVYINHFSWLGIDVRELVDHFGEGTAYRAHNNFIDYTVRCGYIVGFLYLIFYIAIGIKGLMILFCRKHIRPEDFLFVSVIGAYSIQALVEVATLPFTRIIPCMFFLTIAPLMGRSEDTETGDALEK